MKGVVSAGLMGAVVLMGWTLVINGILGFQAGIDMKPVPGESRVYEVLKEHIRGPGRYVCNPGLTADGRPPDNQPVFSILYGGMGHEAAGGLVLVGFAVFLLTPLIGAWLLSQTSPRVQSSYVRKVLFFTAIGLILALFGDLTRFGIGGYPLKDVLALGASHIVAWTLAGLAAAWRIGPRVTAAG